MDMAVLYDQKTVADKIIETRTANAYYSGIV